MPTSIGLACVLRVALSSAAICFAVTSQAALTLMHGYADLTSALLWIQADAPGPVNVTWQLQDGSAPARNATYAAVADADNVVIARLGGLVPGARVAYTVAAGGERREGTLRTQPHWTNAKDAQPITIALGSCFFLADADVRWGSQGYGGEYGIFDAIAAKQPDAMVWLGDNLYFLAQDELDPESMNYRYRRQRSFAPLAKLLTATSHVAIWDDHDYGPNDADMSYVMKGSSLALFKRYWANPAYGLPDTPGVFGRARVGDVEIFLLDDRWYRSANDAIDGPDKTMFGVQQLAWLRNALIHSQAPIKLVATGSQAWNRVNRFEGWNHFSLEQKAFSEWLHAQRIEGVLFLTGDRHFGELLRVARPNAYPIYEFTSSPLTSRPFDQQDAEKNNADMIPGTYAAKRQFGLIRVTGPGNDRTIALEAYDSTGALLWRHELAARELTYANVPK